VLRYSLIFFYMLMRQTSFIGFSRIKIEEDFEDTKMGINQKISPDL